MENEKKTVEAMIGIYCREKHGGDKDLCEECRGLLEYARARLDSCKFGEDKPKCSDCAVHCYKPEMRDRIKGVMRFAGPRMALKHPVLAVKHLSRRDKMSDGEKSKVSKIWKPVLFLVALAVGFILLWSWLRI